MALQATPQDQNIHRKEGKYKCVSRWKEVNYLTSFGVCFGKKDVGGGGGMPGCSPHPQNKHFKSNIYFVGRFAICQHYDVSYIWHDFYNTVFKIKYSQCQH